MNARVALLETRLLAGRNLRHILRVPEKLFGALFMPLIFVVLFSYIFGSAIRMPGGGDYHSYLVSGIFAMYVMSPLPGIAVGVADDIRSGLLDRLRALPIGRVSVLAGRSVAELAELGLGLIVLVVCGLAIGWRPHGSVLETLAAFGLTALFAFALIWGGLLVGMLVRGPDAADGIVMSAFFPLTFVSGVFVPVGGLPTPLRQIAEWNPLTAMATAARDLFHSPQAALPDVWPLMHPELAVVLWSLALIVALGPLAVRRYLRAAS